MSKNQRRYNFIFETTSILPHHDLKILSETDLGGGKHKAAFKARLQESEVRNANKRFYSNSICETIVNALSPKANSRNLLMEIDHPMFVSADPDTLKKRAAIVEIGNCGALMRKINFGNGQIIGEVETLSGFKGPDLANLILKDKVDIGFSLRALGAVEPMHDGSLMVKAPIMPITYDVVSNPSHQTARVLEFIPEHAEEFISDVSMLYEHLDMGALEDDKIRLCEGGVCVYKYVDEIINEQFLDVVSKRLIFKL